MWPEVVKNAKVNIFLCVNNEAGLPAAFFRCWEPSGSTVGAPWRRRASRLSQLQVPPHRGSLSCAVMLRRDASLHSQIPCLRPSLPSSPVFVLYCCDSSSSFFLLFLRSVTKSRLDASRCSPAAAAATVQTRENSTTAATLRWLLWEHTRCVSHAVDQLWNWRMRMLV